MVKKLLLAFGRLVGAFLIVRAVIEPFAIDLRDPSTYHLDWGGPHLVGVLAVHCGPGLLSAALIARWLRTRLGARSHAANRSPGKVPDRPSESIEMSTNH